MTLLTFEVIAAVALLGAFGVVSAQTAAKADYPTHAVPRLQGVTIQGLPAVTGRITVDQFGYLPESRKVAVISDPQVGYNSADDYTPGQTLEIRRKSDASVVFTGSPTVWNEGKTHPDSGDRGWWFDFSDVKEPGDYYVFDPSTKLRSPVFGIAQDVYAPVLRTATRMFYFQRLNTPIFAKHAEGPWTDGIAYPQDKNARAVWAKDDPSLERDLSGGWMDAGDTNKYPTFMADVLHPLLYAYQSNPAAFTDETNIPESGNGLPDLLDEIKFELEWLMKMQEDDGGVYIKMGVIDYNEAWPISTDKRIRYYGPKSSASTLYTAANFAHAARVYGEFPQWKAFADELRERAERAWKWYTANPREFRPDTGEIKSGSANRDADDHDRMEATAAIHLWALTGDESYHEVARKRIPQTRQIAEGVWDVYEIGTAESLIDYLKMPDADPALKDKIRKALNRSAGNDRWAPPADADLYRAWMPSTAYHWGSVSPRGRYGTSMLLAARNGAVSDSDQQRLSERAEAMLHSFHGVNPLSAVLLTNMKTLGPDKIEGAELSMSHMYHGRWGAPAKPYAGNPPPGYVIGGANKSFKGKSKGNDRQVEWISAQPPAKAYADFDLGFPEASWEISEPAIYYQAAYIRLLAEFTKPE